MQPFRMQQLLLELNRQSLNVNLATDARGLAKSYVLRSYDNQNNLVCSIMVQCGPEHTTLKLYQQGEVQHLICGRSYNDILEALSSLMKTGQLG